MIPETDVASANVFSERLEMMVLAFIDKHHRRPKLISAMRMGATEMWAAVFLDAQQVDDDPSVHPKLAELATHGARAWRLWTKLEPDEVVLTIAASAAAHVSKVSIAPRTRTDEVRIARAAIETMDALERKD